MQLHTLREREFPITADYTYLNTAAQGPLPQSTIQALTQAAAGGAFPGMPPNQGAAAEALARSRLAHLLKIGEDDLVFTPNTTYGLNICAHGIDWRPDDNVVVPAYEFPSLMHTWLNLRAFGVETRIVPWQGAGPSVGDLMAAADSRTRVISCSAVAWDTGYRIDLAELGRRCATAGILLVVDGIQAVGAIELDPQALGLAALSFHGYKWLMAGFGCGALYIALNALEHFRPRYVGEQSFVNGGDPLDPALAWQPGARRFTAGGSNTLGLTALAASLGLIADIGLPQIATHNYELSQLLIDGLLRLGPAVQLVTPNDPERHAAIVVFTLGDPPRDEALLNRLVEQRIMVALRPRGIRVSPHLFNTVAEIEALLQALPAAIAATG